MFVHMILTVRVSLFKVKSLSFFAVLTMQNQAQYSFRQCNRIQPSEKQQLLEKYIAFIFCLTHVFFLFGQTIHSLYIKYKRTLFLIQHHIVVSCVIFLYWYSKNMVRCTFVSNAENFKLRGFCREAWNDNLPT